MDRWEAGAGRLWGLCVVPGRMGGSAGEARAEGLRSEVLPPDTWLCACGAWSGQGCTGAILASSVLWLLGATGGSPLICGDCSGEGGAMRSWLLASRPILLRRAGEWQGAAGVEALRPSQKPAGGPGMGGGTGGAWTAGPYRCTRGAGAGSPGVRPKRGITDGRHRARGLRAGDTSRRASNQKKSRPAFSP